jgi:hypothetical protein
MGSLVRYKWLRAPATNGDLTTEQTKPVPEIARAFCVSTLLQVLFLGSCDEEYSIRAFLVEIGTIDDFKVYYLG